MEHDLSYKKPERNYLCDFYIETRIDDTELPVKIKDKPGSLNLIPNPEVIYSIDVSFDAAIYKDREFYEFPVERKQWQIDNLKKQNSTEKAHTIIGEVLSQQLDNICKEISSFNIRYSSASIAGEDFENTNRVDFCIYEGSFAQKENISSDNKKSRQKNSNEGYEHCSAQTVYH